MASRSARRVKDAVMMKVLNRVAVLARPNSCASVAGGGNIHWDGG